MLNKTGDQRPADTIVESNRDGLKTARSKLTVKLVHRLRHAQTVKTIDEHELDDHDLAVNDT